MLKIIKSFRVVVVTMTLLSAVCSVHADTPPPLDQYSPFCPLPLHLQRAVPERKMTESVSDRSNSLAIARSGSGDSAMTSLSAALNNLAGAINELASAPIMDAGTLLNSSQIANKVASGLQGIASGADASALAEVIVAANSYADSLNIMILSSNSGQAGISTLLQGVGSVVAVLQSAASNPNFLANNQGLIASSLLNVSTLFNSIAQNSNFSVQADVDTAAGKAIAFVAVLDALATAWSLTSSLNGTNTTARNALAAFSALMSGVYVYTAGGASVAQIKTVSSAIAAYVAQLMNLKSFTNYGMPTAGIYTIALGPDGNLWAGDFGGGYGICKIGQDGNFMSNYTTVTGGGSVSNVVQITVGPDNNLWFTDMGNGKIGKITTSGSISEYSVPGADNLLGICSGSDGNIWFTNTFSSKIGKITPDGSTITEYYLADASIPPYLAAGADGNIWATDYSRGSIWRITTAGSTQEFQVPSQTTTWGITPGPDGNMWFTEPFANKIGKITPGGAITEYAAPGGSSVLTPFFDQRGNLWIIGRQGSLLRFVPQTGEFTAFTAGLNFPGGSYGLAIDSSRNLWYTNPQRGTDSPFGGSDSTSAIGNLTLA